MAIRKNHLRPSPKIRQFPYLPHRIEELFSSNECSNNLREKHTILPHATPTDPYFSASTAVRYDACGRSTHRR